jgi:excisionase family DNA binding protein
MTGEQPLTLTLPPELLEEIAQRAAAILAERQHPAEPAPDMLSPQEAADVLGLHPRTVLRAIAAGELQGTKVRNRWRITRAALEQWLSRDPSTADRSAVPGRAPSGRRNAMSRTRPLAQAFAAGHTSTARRSG